MPMHNGTGYVGAKKPALLATHGWLPGLQCGHETSASQSYDIGTMALGFLLAQSPRSSRFWEPIFVPCVSRAPHMRIGNFASLLSISRKPLAAFRQPEERARRQSIAPSKRLNTVLEPQGGTAQCHES